MRKFLPVTATTVLLLGVSGESMAYDCYLGGITFATGQCTDVVNSAGSSSERTDHRLYTGLVWEMGAGKSLVPDFLIGFRSLKVKSSDNVQGGDVSLRIKYEQAFSLDSSRLVYVGGNRSLMGNIGAGYSFRQQSLLATAALQTGHFRLGSDYLLSSDRFQPYAEINTLNTPDKERKKQGASGCPTGYEYYPLDQNFYADGGFTLFNIAGISPYWDETLEIDPNSYGFYTLTDNVPKIESNNYQACFTSVE